MSTEQSASLSEDLLSAINEQTEEHEEELETEQPEEATEEIEQTEEAELETEDSEEESEEETEEALEAPIHWSAQDREVFAKIPKDGQEFLLRRHKEMEADYTRKTQEIAPVRRRQEALEEVLTPYRTEYQAQGMDDVAAIRRLFAIHDSLKQNPTQTVLWLAQNYGADLTQTEEELDPNVAALKQQIQQLQQEQHLSKTQAQQSQQQALVRQIQEFEQEKDENGLKHPRFQEVYQDMVKLFESGMSSTLEDAYTKALRLRPDLVSQPAQTKTLEKAKIAQKAKKAASGVKSSGASVTKTEPKTLRDELLAAVEAQSR